MQHIFQNLIASTLVSFIITLIITKIFILLFNKIGLIDDPRQHIHPGIIHKKPIPRGGGAALFLGVSITGIFFLPINNISIVLFIAGLIMLTIGILDDFQNSRSGDVSPYIRFLVNIFVAILVVSAGVSIDFITNPFGGGLIYLNNLEIPILNILISDLVSVLWLIWIMNMVNWSKGVDGQMPGIVAISSIIIGIVSLNLNPEGIGTEYLDVNLSFIIAGAALGFLVFNFHPAKIFPGYGATSIYLLLGVISILTSAKLATAVLVMGIPTIDAIFTIIRRVAEKKSPFRHDNKHLHHNLLKLGYSQRQIALFYWLLSAILGVISLTLDARSKAFALIMLTVVTGGILVFLHFVIDDTK